MRDLWAVLLQTLTASGAAVLLLVVKAIFRDKLSPRWQFGIWGVLGLILLLPAGLLGRYVLVNWPLAVETVKTLLTGSYTLTHVSLPIPLPPVGAPHSVWDWLFVIYAAGVIVLLIRYLISYLRLRGSIRKGGAADRETEERIREVAERYGLPSCTAVTVPGLSSAFICGVLRPVLVLPAERETDEKVLLHELLHLKHRDAVWGIVIGLLRCIHWCNPLLWYCADRAGNDLEARCDQRVLERLDGEDRREYGRILLSMANEAYARAPGTTSAANGGKNIRRRIEAIARFKRYPEGMRLVSVCMAVMLALPLIAGASSTAVLEFGGAGPESGLDMARAFASARTTWCTTPAGALDTYSKALLTQNGVYRAMCAPLSVQADIAASMQSRIDGHTVPYWDIGIDGWPAADRGYLIYNFTETDGGYEAVVVFELNYPPDGREMEGNEVCAAWQQVCVEKEGARWVVIPRGDIQWTTLKYASLDWGCFALPTLVYAGEGEQFRVEVHHQSVFHVKNEVQANRDANWALGHFGTYYNFDLQPKPNAVFSRVNRSERAKCYYLGAEEDKGWIRRIGVACAPMEEPGERPELRMDQYSTGGTSAGAIWGTCVLQEGWDSPVVVDGGGFSGDLRDAEAPAAFAADLYLNGGKVAELVLTPREGGPS